VYAALNKKSSDGLYRPSIFLCQSSWTIYGLYRLSTVMQTIYADQLRSAVGLHRLSMVYIDYLRSTQTIYGLHRPSMVCIDYIRSA